MRCAALAIAVALQAGFWWWLLHCTPVVPVAAESADRALQIVFVERRMAPAPSVSNASTTATAAAPGVESTRSAAAATPAPAPERDNGGAVADGALDLSLPDAMAVVEIGPRDPLYRPRNLDPATTRFARRWKPQADVITAFAWDHPMVAAALAALGGGPPPPVCSELDRRRGKPGCPPLFVQGLQDQTAVFNTARPQLLRPPPTGP